MLKGHSPDRVVVFLLCSSSLCFSLSLFPLPPPLLPFYLLFFPALVHMLIIAVHLAEDSLTRSPWQPLTADLVGTNRSFAHGEGTEMGEWCFFPPLFSPFSPPPVLSFPFFLSRLYLDSRYLSIVSHQSPLIQIDYCHPSAILSPYSLSLPSFFLSSSFSFPCFSHHSFPPSPTEPSIEGAYI